MKKIGFLSFYFVSPLFMIRVLYGLNPVKYSNLNLFFGMCIGVAAYNWFIWQFILSARPKFLDRLMGLDKIYRLHGIMAIGSIGLALGHQMILENIFSENFMTSLGFAAIVIYAGVSVLSVIIGTKSMWMKLKFFSTIMKQLERFKKLKYEHFKWFHNLSFFGLLLMQVHVLMTANAQKYQVVYVMYMVYFLSALVFYVYHKFLKPWIIKENIWKVKRVSQVADQVWDIQMETENHKLNYKPGQFGFFRIEGKNGYEEHPFSFSSTPMKTGHISIAVKALGDFTSGIGKLKKGDQVYLDGPYGDFSYLNYPKEDKTFFIVGGVGITPVISMIRYMSQVEPNRKVTLVWGMRRIRDFIYKEEFRQLQKVMPNLNVIPVVSNDKEYQGHVGYINIDILAKYISPSKHYNNEGFYICGPQILMKNSLRNLGDIGIASSNIHYESFSL